MIRRPPRSTQSRSSAASDVYKRQGQALSRRSTYHRNLRPNCVWRGELAWLVMIPNELDVTLVFGPPNRGVLKAFRNSALNWMRTRSTRLKSLNIDRSKLRIPSLRMSETLGDRLPKVKAAGWLKTVLLK